MAKVLITTAMYDRELPSALACAVSTVVVECSMEEANEIVTRCNDMYAPDINGLDHHIARSAMIISHYGP